LVYADRGLGAGQRKMRPSRRVLLHKSRGERVADAPVAP
jgi:hypothetical protein